MCGATVKTNAIVVPRPEAHRTAHSMQTIRKPPRSVGEETGPTFPKGRTSAVSFRSGNGLRERMPFPHTSPRRTEYPSISDSTAPAPATVPLSDNRCHFLPNIFLYLFQPNRTCDHGPGCRPTTAFGFHRIYFVYLFIEPRKDGLRSKPETHAISVSKARTDL